MAGLLINVVTGGDPVELAGDGVHLSHKERYELTDEFLTIWKELLEKGETDYSGSYLTVNNSKQFYPPVQTPYPPLYFGGSSESGQQIAADHVDVYLTWGEPPKQVEEKINAVRKLADERGRKVRFGIRLHVIVRETELEAWDAANRLIKYVDDDLIAASQQVFSRFDSVGQKRMSELYNGRKDKFGNQSKFMGRGWSCSRRSWNSTCWRPANSCRQNERIRGYRDRDLHFIRISSFGRGLPGVRIIVSSFEFGLGGESQGILYHQPVWRNCCE